MTPGSWREVVGGVDVIVNAAAERHVEKSIGEGASEFVTTNVEGTQILLDAIRETPVERFLLVSSSEVYGTAEHDPMDEDHPLNPRSPYAATKAGGDRLAYSYRVTYDLPIVIVRPFNNYGPRQHPEKVVPRFITQALSGEALTIHGDGRASRDWLHVDDTASAIEALVEAPLEQVAGEVVNVATGVDISVPTSRELVLDAVGNPDATTVHVDERPGQVDRHIGSTEKLAALTGWRASIGFEEGLERTVAWYRENEAWWRGVLGRVARLLVLGAGPAQLGLLEAARGTGRPEVIAVDRDPLARRASRSRTSARFSPRRTSRASTGSPARVRSMGSSRPAPTGRSASQPGSPSGWASRIRSTRASPRSRRRSSASGTCSPRPASRTRGAFSVGRRGAGSRASSRRRPAGAARPHARHAPPAELAPALEAATAESRGGGVLVEEQVEGPEVTVNAFSRRRASSCRSPSRIGSPPSHPPSASRSPTSGLTAGDRSRVEVAGRRSRRSGSATARRTPRCVSARTGRW